MGNSVKPGIYVKKKKAKIGTGSTTRDCVMETIWLFLGEKDGFVELSLVADSLDKVINIREKVAMSDFSKEYSLRDNSDDLYQRLKPKTST